MYAYGCVCGDEKCNPGKSRKANIFDSLSSSKIYIKLAYHTQNVILHSATVNELATNSSGFLDGCDIVWSWPASICSNIKYEGGYTQPTLDQMVTWINNCCGVLANVCITFLFNFVAGQGWNALGISCWIPGRNYLRCIGSCVVQLHV